MFPEENTCNVVIKYYTVDSHGERTLYKTYSEEYAEGEQINIKSPAIEGYKPNKEKVSAIVKSDLNVTVLYQCTHFNSNGLGYSIVNNQYHYQEKYCETCYAFFSGDYEEHVPDESRDKVISYPTSTTVGTLERFCSLCSATYTEEFTTLTRTIVFGGDIVGDFVAANTEVGDYRLNVDDNNNALILYKSGAPEWNIILDGVDIDTYYGIGDGATLSIEYDKSVWRNATIDFRESAIEFSDANFCIRIADGWRVIFQAYTWGSSTENFILSDNCPLKTAPLTLTLTYDYTK